MEKRIGHLKTILVAAAVIFMSGCAGLKHTLTPVETTPDTRRLLSQLTLRNAKLATFKGMGTVHLSTKEGNRRTARVAWIGEAPDKLRLSVLNIGGLPTATMAADGDYFFMASHAPKKFFKTRASNPSLNKLIGIHLKTREVIQILRGRVPIREFDYASTETDARTGDVILTLSSRWGRVLEKIYLSGDRETAKTVEMFNSSGVLVYELKLSNLRELDGFRVPFRIDIASKDDHLLLQIHRYWPHATAPPSTFMLIESEM